MSKLLLSILIFILFDCFIFSSGFALQQVAGTILINVPIGGTSSAKYGLVNDGNETITVSLRAEGDVAPYLSFPETVDLSPQKLIYTDITAKIPYDYDKSLGGELRGYIYALQEGTPGQVKINVQMKKLVNIIIPGLPAVIRTTTTIPTTTVLSNPKQELKNPSTGLVVESSSFPIYPVMIFLVLIIVGMGIYIIKIRR